MIPGRTTVTVPEGHEVHVNAPGGMAPQMPTGMIADPSSQNALMAMNTALASGPQPTGRPKSESGKGEPKPAGKPKKKAKKKPAAKGSKG